MLLSNLPLVQVLKSLSTVNKVVVALTFLSGCGVFIAMFGFMYTQRIEPYIGGSNICGFQFPRWVAILGSASFCGVLASLIYCIVADSLHSSSPDAPAEPQGE